MSDRFAENPTKPENSKAYGGLHIVRMAPGDQSISLDFSIYNNSMDCYQGLDFLSNQKRIRYS
jgi:hypothetical protein